MAHSPRATDGRDEARMALRREEDWIITIILSRSQCRQKYFSFVQIFFTLLNLDNCKSVRRRTVIIQELQDIY